MAEKILAKEQLRAYNAKMLNLGAPVVWDFQGYNKLDYAKMVNLASIDYTYTNRQALWVAKTLKKYTRTQLPEIKDVIDDTILYYKAAVVQSDRTGTFANTIQVATHDKDTLTVLWQFGKNVNDKLKSKNLTNTCKLSWYKMRDIMFFKVSWEHLETLIQAFTEIGLDSSQLKKVKRPKR